MGSPLFGSSSRKSQLVGTAHSYFAFVGSRTTRERKARGNGISVYRIDLGGKWHIVQEVNGLTNPSFLCFDRTKQFLYAVHGDLTSATAFAIHGHTGHLNRLNTIDTGGKNPVHIAVDPSNRFLTVANHLSSTVAVLSRLKDGTLGALVDLTQLKGEIGPHRVEQPFSKPHQTLFDPSGRFILVPDKGLDRTFTFIMNKAGNLQQLPLGFASREGTGPRHLSFTPNGKHAYLLGELDATIVSCRFDANSGRLIGSQRITSTPETAIGNSRAAEIEVSPDGHFVYASNRGDDSIGVFKIQASNGRLHPIGWIRSGGKTPRFLTVTPNGRFLLVANEDSDTIVTMRLDNGAMPLPLPDVVKTGSPVCIVLKAIPN